MHPARVVSVNRGTIKDFVPGVKSGQTAIDKRPVTGQVVVRWLGLEGDEQADKENHGGTEQAVYVYAREDLDWWTEQLGRELRDGMFGENITTAGIDVSSALVGETWRLGDAIVQVTGPRIPCNTFKTWLDEPHWVKRFAAALRPGAYLRVLAEGAVASGDELAVLSKPDIAVTVAESMRAFYGDRDLLARLLQVEGRGSAWDELGAEQGVTALAARR
jgi:MOSC domain-containing protein YiiM